MAAWDSIWDSWGFSMLASTPTTVKRKKKTQTATQKLCNGIDQETHLTYKQF